MRWFSNLCPLRNKYQAQQQRDGNRKSNQADDLSLVPGANYDLIIVGSGSGNSVINDEMNECLAEIRAIVAAERLKRTRQPGLVAFVRELVERP